ncbi:protein NETWORKED 2D-like [Hibiscus syriacus]|uniref:protein NETWORKED 2D-like n=1 Tax=Hibiscus syriacus TaxID=106335 RepID=UPI001924766F|nr:protein NETWORKED 2D-like [Hibiscus syriacus]
MLQRAASNAYSWWWASHVRTKQSKWLERNLQEMEEKVKSVLKLIEEDGDTFAIRAEMYFKKRPELIRFVEESYKAYRALAERYDHLSADLQTANTTIASVCPDQIQFSMDYDGEYGSSRSPVESPENFIGNISMVPELPVKGLITAATKKMQHKKSSKDATIAVAKSGSMKAEGIEEIDRLHKQVLALQTEKEFAKSCYESGLAKYWELDNEINQMQQKICGLEDEFGEGRVIEDNEARNVMAETALRSCEETLVRMQEKHERSVTETKVEKKRIEDAREKLFVLKNKFVLNEFGLENPSAAEDGECEGTKKRMDMESLVDKMKEKFEVGLGESLSVAEMEDKIDELVNNVLNLETAVSSQSALIERLRVETDELQAQIQALDVDKCSLADGKIHLMNKLRKMEEKLHWVQDLKQIVEDRNNELQTQFTEARCNIDRLSVQMHNVKIDEIESSENKINDCDKMPKKVNAGQESEVADVSERENSPADVKSELDTEKQKDMNQQASDGCGILPIVKLEMAAVSVPSRKEEDTLVSANEGSVSHETSKPSEKYEYQIKEQASSMTVRTLAENESKEPKRGPEEEPYWKQLFLESMDNREKNILMELITMLRNYKDTKKKLMEVETNSQKSLSDIMLQLKELKNINAMKDEEILSLRQELNLSRTGLGENNNTDQYAEPRVSTEKSMVVETSLVSPSEEEVREDIGEMLHNQSQTLSEIEEKFRMKIDELLNENLDCWFRFNTAVQEVLKFENGVKRIQVEVLKLDERKKKDESGTVKSPLISDVQPLYQHLTEVQTELNTWVERSLLLKDELKNRFSSLCDIQEEITKESKASAADDDFRLTSYQAAKFLGEISNMKKENNKVAEELQAGLDIARTLQLEVERTLAKLTEDLELPGSKNNRSGQQHSDTRNRIPLRSFIFGVKPKKQKTSIFDCVHPALHRKYIGLRSFYSSK